MFNDLISELNNWQRLTPSAKRYVSDLQETLSEMEWELAYHDLAVTEETEKDFKSLAISTIDTLLPQFLLILDKHLREAIVVNKEYEWYALQRRLESCLLKEDTFDFTIEYSMKKVFVTVEPYKTAGYPEEWMEAVHYGNKGDKFTPEQRSEYWKKLYQIAREGAPAPAIKTKKSKGKFVSKKKIDFGKYTGIINSRLALDSGAGYWYFLDKGSVNMPGYEGTAYPVALPTNFVEKSEIECQRLMDTYINTELARTQEFSGDNKYTETLRKEYEHALVELDTILKSLAEFNMNDVVMEVDYLNKRMQLIVRDSKRFGKRIGIVTKRRY